MPQQLQQSAPPATAALPAIRPVAAPVTVAVRSPGKAGRLATIAAAMSNEEYVQWYQMKRAGFWKWVLVENGKEEFASASTFASTLSSSLIQTALISPGLLKEMTTLQSTLFWLGLIFTLVFEFNLVMAGACKWFLVKKKAARHHAALGEAFGQNAAP